MASLVTSSPMGQLRPTTPCGTNDELSPMTGNETNVTGLGFPQYYKGAQIGFLVVLFFLIVIGNVVVLAAIAVNKERRKSRMNFFIMHLALSDLLTGPLVVLADLISKISIYWSAGNAVCRLHKFAQVVVMYSSTYLLVALSLDRLDAVARPLQFTSAWLRVKILVSLAWGLSLAFALPQLVLFHVHEIHGGPMCGLELSLSGWQIYLSLIAVSL
ncbi:cardioacceleratory peptide receptor, partial [Aplysia californica]|uniref:Cardioacceleratory peptide receptor n=1 Tax=Aplysia californica TaxID=6500 RepID=A0ABM1A629_APLCA